MPISGPSISDLKKLFARSGNRCAFPKCTAAIVDGDTVLGEMAHIKGAKPGSARYDTAQTPEERHAYANLILVCPNHHTIVDADEVSYSVERLVQLKATHEAAVTPVSDPEADRAVQFFIDQPVTIVGAVGVVSGIVHSQQVVLPSTNDTSLQHRRILATENVWKTLQRFRNEFSEAIFIDTILLDGEIDGYFRSTLSNPTFSTIQQYVSQQTVPDKFARADKDTINERPFINPRAWGIAHVLKALYGRHGLLLPLSFKERAFRSWKKDDPLDHLLRAVLPGNVVDEAKKRQIGGLQFLIEHLEIDFMKAANTQP